MGVKVLPPDVNASVATFTAVGEDVRFGLAAIRNVGANVVEAIVATRKSKGEFTSFADFLRKVPAVVCNKRVIESLIKAGAFDSFGHPRKGLALIHEQAVDSVIDLKRNEAIGQDSPVRRRRAGRGRVRGGDPRHRVGQEDPAELRAGDARPLRLRPPAARHRAHHREGHRHLGRRADGRRGGRRRRGRGDRPAGARTQRGRNDGQIVKIGGILSGVTRKVTKKGDAWAAATLEDLGGAIEVLFFPNSYQLYATAIADDAIVIVKGKVDRREDVPKLIAMDMTIPDLTTGADGTAPIVLAAPGHQVRPPGRRAAPRRPAHPPGHHRGPPAPARQPEDHGRPPRRQAPRHRQPRPCTPTSSNSSALPA